MSDEQLMDTIYGILLENIDNTCGGLFASEIQTILDEQNIQASLQKINLLIKFQGRRIKIRPIEIEDCIGTHRINLYLYPYIPNTRKLKELT